MCPRAIYCTPFLPYHCNVPFTTKGATGIEHFCCSCIASQNKTFYNNIGSKVQYNIIPNKIISFCCILVGAQILR